MEFKSEKLTNIWKLIFGEEKVTENEETAPEEESKSKFMDATLEDGTLVQIEPALEVGAAVVVIDADGNPMAAEDAQHVLADGTKVTTKDGLIVEIIPAEVVEEEVVEEMEVAPTESQEQRVKKVVESIIKESHFVSEEKVTELTNAITEQFNAKVEELKNSMFKAFEEFGKTEEKEPTKQPAKFKKEKKESWVDRFKG